VGACVVASYCDRSVPRFVIPFSSSCWPVPPWFRMHISTSGMTSPRLGGDLCWSPTGLAKVAIGSGCGPGRWDSRPSLRRCEMGVGGMPLAVRADQGSDVPIPGARRATTHTRQRPSMAKFQLTGGEESIDRALRQVKKLSACLGFTAVRIQEVTTAVREALANAVQHGNRGRTTATVRFFAWEAQGALLVEIRDAGSGLERMPSAPDLGKQILGLEPVAGWGLHLMCTLASEVRFVHKGRAGHAVRFEAQTPPHRVQPMIISEQHAP
jgi:anti-sigma regulatory factor (Ser/Thr protein kinase)